MGIKQNIEKGIKYFEKAAELNNSYAFHILGVIYHLGINRKKDNQKAIFYFKKALKLR